MVIFNQLQSLLLGFNQVQSAAARTRWAATLISLQEISCPTLPYMTMICCKVDFVFQIVGEVPFKLYLQWLREVIATGS